MASNRINLPLLNSFAKQLIEETIKRNVSPIRETEGHVMTDTLFKDNLSDSDNDDNHCEMTSDLTSFKYTLNFKENSVRITGNNLDLVNVSCLSKVLC